MVVQLNRKIARPEEADDHAVEADAGEIPETEARPHE
jgi:hypothetical protein